MTTLRAQQLEQRRLALLRRSRDLRHLSRIHGRSLNPVLDWVDRIRSAVSWLQTLPTTLLWPAAGALGMWTARRPGKVGSLALRLWSGWKMWQRLTAGRRRV